MSRFASQCRLLDLAASTLLKYVLDILCMGVLLGTLLVNQRCLILKICRPLKFVIKSEHVNTS